jgi:hypothetical protein
MEWSWTFVGVQLVFGILGAHAAATAAHDHGFGALGHTLVGALGGASSGYFLQTLAAVLVTGNGSVNEPRLVEQVFVQALTGAVAGGIAMLVIGLIKHAIDQHKVGKAP